MVSQHHTNGYAIPIPNNDILTAKLEEYKKQKQINLSIASIDSITEFKQKKNVKKNFNNENKRKHSFITQTLSEDYPGLDYLGFHNVLSAKRSWYRILWFTIVTICLLVGLYTTSRYIRIFLKANQNN